MTNVSKLLISFVLDLFCLASYHVGAYTLEGCEA